MTNPFSYEHLPLGPEKMLAIQFHRLADYVLVEVPDGYCLKEAMRNLWVSYTWCRAAHVFEAC